MQENKLITQNEPKLMGFKPRLITGGKDGDENWLADLTRLTVFLCRKKIRQDNQLPKWVLSEMMVQQNFGKVAQLYTSTQTGEEQFMWVPTLDFSRDFELIYILQNGVDVQQAIDANEASQEEGATNDVQSDTPDRAG